MNATQAATLKVGDRVMWDRKPTDAGTVVDTGYNAVTIKWDNGQTGTIHHRDADIIERLP